ncbi:MAG: hypothetical protein KDB90_04370 [Planctomycetes bacterium]|nr:hypothetical protein [Planctomycetota bacterium]
MAGPAPQQAQQPYGVPNQPMPQYAPPGRQKGSVAPKVWGVILLIFGLFAAFSFISSLVTLGGGISGSTFAPGLSPEVKQEMDRMTAQMISDMKGRWSFWLNMAGEGLVMALSFSAGIWLVIKPKPLGRKLAIARALLVLLLVPVAGYEGVKAIEGQLESQAQIMKLSTDDAIKKQEASNPSANNEQAENRRKRAEETMDSMQPLVRGASYGVVIVTSIGVLVINCLLLFFMTRPAVKEYLESVEEGGDNSIPGYDPSMGLVTGPPPGPPHPGQPSPANQPPEPPRQQTPPV